MASGGGYGIGHGRHRVGPWAQGPSKEARGVLVVLLRIAPAVEVEDDAARAVGGQAVVGEGEAEVGLADAGGAVDHGQRPREQAAAEHGVELGDSGRSSPSHERPSYSQLSFGLELAGIEAAQLSQGGGLGRPLVVADARDAGEAQGEARRVGRALLDLVVRDLHHDLGPHAHGVPVVADGQPAQPLRHLAELLVGQPLEGLAHVGEAVAVDHGEVIVGQPARAAPRAPIRGDDDAVDRVGALELEPALAATSGRVGAGEILGHDALVTAGEGPIAEAPGGLGRGDDLALGEVRAAGEAGQRLPARGVRLVDQRAPVDHRGSRRGGGPGASRRRATPRRGPAGSAASAPERPAVGPPHRGRPLRRRR